jgi:hypothetical protein
MKRRIWIIVSAVTLTVAAIGGVAAFAGGGEEDQDAKPSLGVPAPGFPGIDETEVSDGSGLDTEILPKYDGEADEPPITEGPVEEGVRGVQGAAVTTGELADGEGGVTGGDGPLVMEVPAPGFAGLVDEMVVAPSPIDSPADEVDTR